MGNERMEPGEDSTRSESVVHNPGGVLISGPGYGSGRRKGPIKIFFVAGWTVNLSSKVDHQEMGCGWLVGALMLWFES